MQRNTALLAAILIVLIIIAVAVIASALMLRNGVPTPAVTLTTQATQPAPTLSNDDATATWQAALDIESTAFYALPAEVRDATMTAAVSEVETQLAETVTAQAP